MENLDKIVGYFEPGKTPTYEEFKKSWTSFFHKSEKFPQTQVVGLNDELNKLEIEKAPKSQVDAIANQLPNLATKDDLQSVMGGLRPLGSVETEAELRAIVAPNDNDSYYVNETIDENDNPYIWRFDKNIGEHGDWVNTKQVVYKDVARAGGSTKTLQDVDDSVVELEVTIKRDIFGNVNIIDKNGNIGLQLTSKGQLRVLKFELDAIDINSFVDTINSTLINTSKGIITFEDSQGYIAMRINADSSIDVGKLNVKELNALNIKQSTPHIWGNATDYIIIETFGQSNAIGQSAIPIISEVQKYDSKMLDGLINASGSSLVLLTEKRSTWYLGETNLSGWAESIIEEVTKKRFLDWKNKGFQIVGNCIGAGGQPISTFLKGTDVYNKGITSITDIKNIADKENKNVSVAAVAWIQSESNMSPHPITIEQYESDLLQLFIDKNKDYKAITKQKNDILFLGYQTAWGNWNVESSVLNIPLLYYKLHKKSSNFFLAAAWYPFTYLDENGQYIHIDATSQKWFGQYLGRAYKRILIDNNTTVVTEPIAFSVTEDNVIKIKCKAPCLPLVIDTENLPKATESLGFKVFDANNNRLIISENDISVDYDTISIKCPSKPSKVNYAVGGQRVGGILGNRGNIRDSQGDNDTWNGKRMDNWLLMFEQNL